MDDPKSITMIVSLDYSPSLAIAEVQLSFRQPALPPIPQNEARFNDREMSDEAKRPCPRLTESQSALIRFLSKRNILPREITAHPKCGWVVSTIHRHNRRNCENDAEFITPDFPRIFAEQIKAIRKKNELQRGPKPPPLPEERALALASVPKMPGRASAATQNTAASGLMSKEDFLDRFVQSASMDPSCAGLLRARLGFKTTETLCRNAKKMHDIANRYSREEVETYFGRKFPTMTPADVGRLIKALLRLGKSLC
ncbi:hypothetical protein DFH06DRAFT_1209887 [Mycena polygramma]|nr:hypothetical protein DFH06DRAFT_1209887 [Mycena polygramma]